MRNQCLFARVQVELTVIAAAVLLTGHAQAASLTVTGTTTGAPTFDRPVVGFADFSPIGVGVNFSAFEFVVATAGIYEFVTSAPFDSFTLLYAPTFAAAMPLNNGVESNDDLTSYDPSSSGFTANLTPGVHYTYVVTGFAKGDAGAFSTTMSGPGMIAAVPEVTTYALMLAGLMAVCGVARRRHRRAAD